MQFLLMTFLCMMLGINFFPQFDADDGGMKPEENGQRQGYPLDQNPWHKTIKVFFNLTRPHFLDLKGEDDPLGQIEEKEENRDLATRHDVFLVTKILL